MTSMLETTSVRRTFCDLVDGLGLPTSADAIIVLRNWDTGLTQDRLERGLNLMQRKLAPLMLMSYDEHTKSEADRMYGCKYHMQWQTIVLVTHKSHSYRALLTFIQRFADATDIYVSRVGSRRSQEEFDKIDAYQAKGDIATYEKGVEYLKWISHGRER